MATMTTTLLESKAKPFGSSKGALISMAIHGAVIAAAVFATAQVVLPPREKVEEHPVLYVAAPPPKALEPPPAPLPKAPTPPKPKASPEKVFKAPPAPPKRAATPTPRPVPTVQPKVASAPAIVAPTKVALSLPAINPNAAPVVDIAPVAAPEPIKASGIATGGSVKSDGDVNGSEGGRKGGLTSGNSGKAYDEDQVDKPVQVSRKVDPRYPDALKSVNVEGSVRVRFIVSADGRVEPGSIEVLETSHKLFAESVKTALMQMRFRPAEAGGQRVRQLVEQPFSFKLQNGG